MTKFFDRFKVYHLEDDSHRSYNGEEFTAKIYFNGQFVKEVGKEIFESSYSVTTPHVDLVQFELN